MKKFFTIVALAGTLVACSNDKKEAEKTEDTTTTAPATTEPEVDESTNNEPTTTAVAGVPTFSDPEVQKFANDYAAFITEYKTGIKDPAKMQALSASMQDWSTRANAIVSKLLSKPDEAQAWSAWFMKLSQDLKPAQ